MEKNDLEEIHPIPILKIGNNLIVSIQGDLTDRMVESLQNSILRKIEKTNAKGLLIDVSSLEVIDSFVARSLINTARMAKYMDTETVITGISPEIALTLIQMGFHWGKITTAVTVEQGLKILEGCGRRKRR